MNIELTNKEFRRLLDMVYIGNWVLNSTRAEDRFKDYDDLQEKIFGCCAKLGLKDLYTTWYGHVFPSRAFEEGGIHEAIADYEDAVFYDILAEELARRDMSLEHTDPDDVNERNTRIDEYFDEFEANGIDNLMIEK